MKKGLKKFLRVFGLTAGGLTLVLVAAVLLVRFDKPLTKRLALDFLARKSGVTLTGGTLDYRFFPLRVVMTSARATYRTSVFSVEVGIRRLEARGSLGRLIRGEAPAFESADIEVSEFLVVQPKVSETPLDFQAIVLQARGILSYFRRVSLKCGDLSLSFPGVDLRFEDIGLALSSTRRAGTYGLVLDVGRAGGTMGAPRLSLGGRLRADGTLALGRTTGIDLRLSLEPTSLGISGRTRSLRSLRIEARGDWRTDRNSFSFARMALGVPGVVGFSGSGALDLGGAASSEMAFKLDVQSLADLGEIASVFVPGIPPGLLAGGNSKIEGRYALGPHETIGQGRADVAVELREVALKGTWKGVPASSGVSGRLKVTGSPFDPQVTGEVEAAFGSISLDRFSVRRPRLKLKAEGTRRLVNIRALEANLEGVSWTLPGRDPLTADAIKLAASGRADILRQSIEDLKMEIRLPGVSPLRLSGRVAMQTPIQGLWHVESRGLGVPALRRFLAPLEPKGFKDWTADGALDITLDAERKTRPRASLSFSGELVLSGGKFNDPAFLTAGDGLRSSFRFNGSRVEGQSAYGLSASLGIDQGESLWKDLYVSWKENPFNMDVAGSLEPRSGTLAGLKSKVVLSGVGDVEAEGEARLTAPLSFALKSGTRLDLRRVLALQSRAGASPKGMGIDGRLSGRLELAKSGTSTTIKGRLALEEGLLESATSGMRAEGITADLPVNLTVASAQGTAQASPEGSNPEEGDLKVGLVKSGSRAWGPFLLKFRSRRDAYVIDPVSLDIGGVRLVLGETELRFDAGRGDIRARTSLDIPDFDLAGVLGRSSRLPLTGRARARFPVVDLTPAGLTTQGQAEADVFGGRVVLRNVGLNDPLAAGREVSCDVDLEDIDLKKVTDIVPFGEVTGLLRGRIEGLTVSYGEVERFDLEVESVPKKGVAQTFSLKAVNNLTILSTGQTAAANSPFWMRFIRGFRYGRIGIVSTLRNDTFTLNGTIHENGLEYLVRKSGLLGIDIIDRMPEAKISFSDMKGRLARIGQPESVPMKGQEEK